MLVQKKYDTINLVDTQIHIDSNYMDQFNI